MSVIPALTRVTVHGGSSWFKPPIPLHVRGAGLPDRVLPSTSAPPRSLPGPDCLVRDRLAIVRQCRDMSMPPLSLSLSPSRPATLSHFFFPKGSREAHSTA